ncbi:3-oxoacyl-[acyl-carrier-protein] reductase FabG-like [Pieris rapae]|uniref:3-oxoacyl-[acyl-carrier-protein] reductase FabG-like n=1 Tax=Pieris rapae TaxID=64459 RepID=UPI001E27F059|nr:3-oxoacyl-[acyl-carrier-protein] reductase FabG-like [Pieris rapae]
MIFSNKVVLVTGASSGIGAATAIEFAKEGAIVAIVARNEEKLNKIAHEIEKVGQKPLILKSDISDDNEAKNLLEQVITKLGKLDILVNNAGLTRFGSILEGNILQSYDEIMKVNVRAHINITTLAAPYLIKTQGNIVNISSVAGKILPSYSSMISYHISKAALTHFSRCAALELASKGVRVNIVSPGPVKTDLLENAGVGFLKFEDVSDDAPLKRVSESVEVADIVLFLASNKAKGITGSEYVADNGWCLRS